MPISWLNNTIRFKNKSGLGLAPDFRLVLGCRVRVRIKVSVRFRVSFGFRV